MIVVLSCLFPDYMCVYIFFDFQSCVALFSALGYWKKCYDVNYGLC